MLKTYFIIATLIFCILYVFSFFRLAINYFQWIDLVQYAFGFGGVILDVFQIYLDSKVLHEILFVWALLLTTLSIENILQTMDIEFITLLNIIYGVFVITKWLLFVPNEDTIVEEV